VDARRLTNEDDGRSGGHRAPNDSPVTTKAVILARGIGTRMRREDPGAWLTAAQAAAADEGLKSMMPLDRGRPFLHYVLSALADARVQEICLVVAPDSGALQRHFHHEMTLRRVRIDFAIQEEPHGTADAVLAAESFVGSDRFLVLNADNYYPVDAYRALVGLNGSGLCGFDREALTTLGNIDAERIRRYAILEVGADGFLEHIIEKPDDATFASMGPHALVSMNLWAFTPVIFEACRRVTPSPRGELEIPDAVRIAMNDMGEPFVVVPQVASVLDLANRSDVATVESFLRSAPVSL
jgi:dTDP-glucose pyrophosphorylase